MIYMEKRQLASELVNFLHQKNRYAIFKIVNDKEDIVEIQTNLSQLETMVIPTEAIFLGDEKAYAKKGFVKVWYRQGKFRIFNRPFEQ